MRNGSPNEGHTGGGRPRHEPEVLRARAVEIADELRDRLRGLGFTAQEAACIALAAEREALQRVFAR